MNNFRDVSALHSVLRAAYEKIPAELRRDALSECLVGWGFRGDHARLYASTVLSENTEGSADAVSTNVSNIVGSWARGTQEGSPSAWLNSMTETWKFDDDLTYEHRIDKYEGYVSPIGSPIPMSYSRPSRKVERGIWAAPDVRGDVLRLFVMSTEGAARTIRLVWVDKGKYTTPACTIDGERFARAY
jgi:hypothetical protein